ncbi:hypothetical protein [Niabella drilacis]|uniref:hypothetical protein n=1 Tax=Niabella drilacis (strain DSM 25811 / CCM 8410 / CCUG 62505 / LMG 26954 / E90) TaxID=1285928 RepID=UPI0015A06CEA|nr:hypothetical protein [Niabella drilacis]
MGSRITAPQTPLADSAFVLVLEPMDQFENDGIKAGSRKADQRGYRQTNGATK